MTILIIAEHINTWADPRLHVALAEHHDGKVPVSDQRAAARMGCFEWRSWWPPVAGASLADLLGQPYEKSLGPTDVAEPIGVLVPDHLRAHEPGTVLPEAGQRVVDVVHGEHDA